MPRLGHTKVFFRAGAGNILACMTLYALLISSSLNFPTKSLFAVGCVEETREECIKAILNYIQGLARGYCSRMEYKKLIYKRDMIPVMQR